MQNAHSDRYGKVEWESERSKSKKQVQISKLDVNGGPISGPKVVIYWQARAKHPCGSLQSLTAGHDHVQLHERSLGGCQQLESV